MVLAVCRWYAVLLKFWVFFQLCFVWAGFWILLNDILIRFDFCRCRDSDNPVPQFFSCFRVLYTFEEGVWGRVELNSQSAIAVTSFRFETKSHPIYTHCLPSCPHINVTHLGMNQMTATICYVGQRVGWCDWLVTQNSRYWHHKIWNIPCLNSHSLSQFMLKLSLYQHICVTAFVCYWCLLITSNCENLRLPLHTVHTQARTRVCKFCCY
jgi:hypothetical protein